VTTESWIDERHARPHADAVVERLLAAYAAVQSPDRAAMRRIRGELLGRIGAIDTVASSRPVLTIVAGGGRSRRALALLAATLLVGTIAGGVLATAPGGSLYASRLWVEDLLLPSDPAARTNAELAHLQERLDEASRAAQQGNGGAVAAALRAYREAVAAALAATGGDLDREARIQFHLAQHRLLLEALAGSLPDAADAGIGRAIQNAIQHSETVTTRSVDGKPTGGSGGQGAGSEGAGGQGAGGQGSGSRPATRPDRGGRTGKPVRP
jgi:hypothetical protein